MPRRQCNTWAVRAALKGEQRYADTPITSVRPKVRYGGARGGRFVHRVERLVALWPKGAAPYMGAQWDCGGNSNDAVLGLEVEDRPLCSRCDWAGADGPTVYFVERDGLIKIGCSSSVFKRVPELKGRLLAIEPGGFGKEWELHEQFNADRAFGEWFRPSDGLMLHIASLTGAA